MPWGAGSATYRLRAARRSRYRWGVCAKDVCFKEGHWISYFASACKVLPIDRNGETGGVWQPEMEAVVSKLRAGDWVHYFPEGRIKQVRRRRHDWSAESLGSQLPTDEVALVKLTGWGTTYQRLLVSCSFDEIAPSRRLARTGRRGAHVQTRRRAARRRRSRL